MDLYGKTIGSMKGGMNLYFAVLVMTTEKSPTVTAEKSPTPQETSGTMADLIIRKL